MIISDIRRDFYNKLVHKRVLILVNFDVDAICACRILQTLFRSDHVLYTLVPVNGLGDLKQEYADNSEKVKYVVLINCGGSIDLSDTLDPSDDTIIYVIDSHRPLHTNNIYNDQQIRIVSPIDTDDNVPAFDDIYQDDSDNDTDDDESAEKRPRYDEVYLDKRRKKREWNEKRTRILLDYYHFSYYGSCSALLMYDLALKMSRDTRNLLWLGLVGLTEQYLLHKIEHQKYLLDTGNQQGHIARYSHEEGETTSIDCLRLSFDQDLNLVLYRHWSLFDSLRYTPYIACQLKLFTLKGEKRLHEFLAEIGLPLTQCKQKYNSMDLLLKSEVHSGIQEKAEKYHLEKITYGSFFVNHGYAKRYCAADIVYAMLAILEQPQKKIPADCFMEALDCLNWKNCETLDNGIALGTKMFEVIYRTVRSLLDMHKVISTGSFLYSTLSDGDPDALYFRQPNCLSLLAHFTLRAFVATERSKRASARARTLPLLLSAPHDPSHGTCLIIGVPPISEDSPRNLFGRAFERAADQVKARIEPDYFDSSVLKLQIDDRTKFLDALISLMA